MTPTSAGRTPGETLWSAEPSARGCQLISIGSGVPAANAREVIRIARRHLPGLRYIVITEDRPDVARAGGRIGDRDVRQDISIGVTNRAVEGFRSITPISNTEFARLLAAGDDAGFKRAIRAYYSVD